MFRNISLGITKQYWVTLIYLRPVVRIARRYSRLARQENCPTGVARVKSACLPLQSARLLLGVYHQLLARPVGSVLPHFKWLDLVLSGVPWSPTIPRSGPGPSPVRPRSVTRVEASHRAGAPNRTGCPQRLDRTRADDHGMPWDSPRLDSPLALVLFVVSSLSLIAVDASLVEFASLATFPASIDRMNDNEQSLNSIFTDIQQDSHICSNCFRRTHDTLEQRYAVDWVWDPSDQSYDFWARFVDRGQSTRRDHSSTVRVPADDGYSAHGEQTICACGARRQSPDDLDDGETWKFRPLEKPMFFEYADHLAERVESRPRVVEFDRDVFWDVLDRLKTDPDEQFADDRIFGHAVDAAVVVETTDA